MKILHRRILRILGLCFGIGAIFLYLLHMFILDFILVSSKSMIRVWTKVTDYCLLFGSLLALCGLISGIFHLMSNRKDKAAWVAVVLSLVVLSIVLLPIPVHSAI